jgi:dTDP-4-dehydrorhamnose reductase
MKRPLAATSAEADTVPSTSSSHEAAPRLKVLITGGSGYVGRFLVPALESEGYDVVAVSRSSSPVALDVSDAAACARVLAEVRPDIIVHAAANSSPKACEEDPAGARQANVPLGFISGAREANPAVRFIFLSTDQVLNGQGHLVDEAVEANPINVYGQTKLEMEAAVREAFPQHTIVRLSFIYGPKVEGAHTTFLQFAMDKLKAGEEFSVFTDQIRSAVYVGDVVETLKLAVSGQATGLLNLGGPEALSRFDFCKIVAEHLGVTQSILKGGTYNLPVPSPSDISMDVSRLGVLLRRQPLRLADALLEMQSKL